MTSTSSGTLVRQLGLGGAVVTGLGSILGTGVFVSIAIAAGEAGAWVMLAAPLAALVAIGNGMSSAQLAAAHPVAGGTYEYGYRYLHPWAGHVAGVLFLTAKSASAATAALGFATYLLALIGVDDGWRVPIAVATVVAVTALVIAGVRRTTTVNLVLVALTIGALLVFVVGGTVSLATDDLDPARLDMSGFAAWWRVLPEATALMFVAYTGYGRIATLGEEVRDPRQTIPRAVIATLAVSALLYTSVAVVGWRLGGIEWRVDGADGERINAPLAALLDGPVARVIELGALAAMVGVLLNLVLGLSRVWLAMGRRRDLPHALATLDDQQNPTLAVVVTGVVVGAIALLGDLRLAWSFSAFTVLLYYAVTNAAALRLPAADRWAPRLLSWFGLASCAFLAFWVDGRALAMGAALVTVTVLGRIATQRFGARPSDQR
ncbi:MAG: APC family permease [Acidimicrobiales bacterium]